MNAAAILAGGARLVRTQPAAVAIWGGVYLAACIGMMLLVAPMFVDLAAFQQQAILAQASRLPPPPPPAGLFGGILLFNVALLVLLAAIFAAAVRAVAAGDTRDSFGFLRFGMDELRLVGLGVTLVVVGIVAMFLFGIVVGIVIAVLAALGGDGGAGVAIALTALMMLTLCALILWLEVRISLAGALAVLRGRIVIREAWRMTRGRFWTLFGVYLLIGIAYVAVTILLVALTSPDLLSAYAGGMRPEAMQAALAQQQAMLADPFSPRVILMWLFGSVVMAVGIAFTFGAIATAAIGFDRADHAG